LPEKKSPRSDFGSTGRLPVDVGFHHSAVVICGDGGFVVPPGTSLTGSMPDDHDCPVLRIPSNVSQGMNFMTEQSSAQGQPQPVIEPEGLEPLYANFARVSGLPEELVLDFGLNPQPFGATPLPVKVSQRMVMNYFTAKRLWLTLGAFIQRHEQAFGGIEIDIAKRVVPTPPPAKK
jgi:hypothetical protein